MCARDTDEGFKQFYHIIIWRAMLSGRLCICLQSSYVFYMWTCLLFFYTVWIYIGSWCFTLVVNVIDEVFAY